MAKITVQNTKITIVSFNEQDYIPLTDMTITKFCSQHFGMDRSNKRNRAYR